MAALRDRPGARRCTAVVSVSSDVWSSRRAVTVLTSLGDEVLSM
jgi:hypothetical protein